LRYPPVVTQAASQSQTYVVCGATCPCLTWTAWGLVASFAGVASVDGQRGPTSFVEELKGVVGAAAFDYVAAFPAFLASDRAILEVGTYRVSTCGRD